MKNVAVLKRVLMILVVAGVVLAMAPCIRADSTYTENITVVGSAISGCSPACTGPWETMEVDLTSADTAVITITGLSNGDYQYLLGDDSQALALNVNSNDFQVSGITATQVSGFTSITYTPHYYFTAPYSGYDSLGDFNFVLDGTGAGFNTAAESISFTVTDENGATWASVYNVLANNTGSSHPVDVGVHTYACIESDCTSSPTLSEEGNGGSYGASVVPEPASIALFGTVLCLVALARRRRR